METTIQNTILHHCQLKNNAVFLDGKLYFENQEAENFSTFAKSFYKFLEIKYPKFYKMDDLSKLGFLTFECLIKNVADFSELNHDKTGVFLANTNSSLHTDTGYWATTQAKDGHPSPSLFVYTLPNIVIGEMCIRHKIKGEHGFFVFEQIDSEFICNYVNDLLNRGQLNACVVGWIERFEEKVQSNFLWVKKGTEGESFTPNDLKRYMAI